MTAQDPPPTLYPDFEDPDVYGYRASGSATIDASSTQAIFTRYHSSDYNLPWTRFRIEITFTTTAASGTADVRFDAVGPTSVDTSEPYEERYPNVDPTVTDTQVVEDYTTMISNITMGNKTSTQLGLDYSFVAWGEVSVR